MTLKEFTSQQSLDGSKPHEQAEPADLVRSLGDWEAKHKAPYQQRQRHIELSLMLSGACSVLSLWALIVLIPIPMTAIQAGFLDHFPSLFMSARMWLIVASVVALGSFYWARFLLIGLEYQARDAERNALRRTLMESKNAGLQVTRSDFLQILSKKLMKPWL